MIDTHTHLYDPAYAEEGQAASALTGQIAAVDRAVAAGVGMMLMPNAEIASIAPLRALHAARPDCTRMAMALHPTELGDDWRANLKIVLDEIDAHAGDYVAIGECGIDLYTDRSHEDEQMQAFEAQCAKAREFSLPLLIHCREGLPQTLEVLRQFPDVPAVFHCFGGTPADVEAIRRVGDYWFGIGGVVTFKNSNLRATLPAIGADRLLTETDSPYLAPVPYRGKRNESAMIPIIVDTMAQAMGMDPQEMAEITTANALSFIPKLGR